MSSPSRYLNPTTPGGLLSPVGIGTLTADEELVVQSITDGSYFVTGEVPSGTIDGVNDTFTLAYNPNPDSSLILTVNGQVMKAGGDDYVLTGTSIVFAVPPSLGSIIVAALYIVSPV